MFPRDRNDTLATQQQSGEYVPGVQRNLAGTNSSHVVWVDSRSRDLRISQSANDFFVEFLPGQGYKNVVSVRLLMAIIPILNTDVHPTTPAEVNPYVVMHADALSGVRLDTIEGVHSKSRNTATEPRTHNSVADGGAMAIIPLIPAAAAEIGVPPATVVVNYAVWREEVNHPVVKYFRPPIANLTGLHIKLFQWGQSTDPRTQFDPYALPPEIPAPLALIPPQDPLDTDPSEMVPQNNVQFMFEITSSS